MATFTSSYINSHPVVATIVRQYCYPDCRLFCQFLLDCSALPEVIAAVQQHGNVILEHLFNITRIWVYALHRDRLKILGRWRKFALWRNEKQAGLSWCQPSDEHFLSYKYRHSLGFKGTLTKISHYVAAIRTNVKIRKSITDCFLTIKIKIKTSNITVLVTVNEQQDSKKDRRNILLLKSWKELHQLNKIKSFA